MIHKNIEVTVFEFIPDYLVLFFRKNEDTRSEALKWIAVNKEWANQHRYHEPELEHLHNNINAINGSLFLLCCNSDTLNHLIAYERYYAQFAE